MSNKVPQIRFNGYSDAWVQRNLSDLATFSKGKGYSKSDLVSDGFPAILYGRMYTNYESQINDVSDTFVADVTDAVLSQTGDVIVPGSGETPEDIARASNVNVSGVVLGGDINIIRPDAEKMDSTFLALTISNGQQQTELIKRAQGKSVVHLHNSDLKKVNVVAPSKDEQRAISSLFNQLDNLIDANHRKLDLLKEQKKGYLQKMFPKNGAKVPELRFAGFADDWEERKLGDIFVYKQGQQVPVENQFTKRGKNRHRFIRIVDLTTKNEAPRYIEYSGDNIISSTDLFMIRYGQPGVIGYGYEGVIANNLFKLIPKIETYNLFFKYILDSMYPKIQSLSSSTTMPAISFKSLDVLAVKYPDKKEQEKIGSFFKQLDNTIALHQRKLELLKEQKKGFLQKMFV